MTTQKTPENPIASILILCQDNLEMLRECLASIERSVDRVVTPFEVIVLFQQTSSTSVQSFMEGVEGVRQLQSRLNLGFGGGNNYAARYAKGKYLVFLNDDTIAHSGWLHHLVQTAERDESIGAVGSRILFLDGALQEAGAIIWSDGSCYPLGRRAPSHLLAYSYVRLIDYSSANGLLVRRSVFHDAGGFDERFYPGYYEDVDLCLTLRHKLGLRIVYEPRSVIFHRESATYNRDPEFRTFLFRRHQAELRSKWAHVLSTYPAPRPESPVALEDAMQRARGKPKRVLVVDDRVPSVGLGSGFGRTADLLSDLSAAGYAVAFAPTDRGCMPTENKLGGIGIDLVLEPLAEHLQRPEKRYDVLIISRPHNYGAYYAAARAAQPDAVVIYDVEALYHRRLLLQAGLERDCDRANQLRTEADRMEALEIEIARSVDRLVAISESEVEWLNSIEHHAPVDFMRPLSSEVRTTPEALEARSGAIFVAGWLAGEKSPNVDALRWYAEHVLPRVRASLPDFVTYVSGSNPPLSVQSMVRDGLVLTGFVNSVDSLYRSARTAISPILAGAGVKIKTIEAMQYGVPVVATSVGAEGLGLTDDAEIDITDDAAEFASRIIALASDNALWLRRRSGIKQRITEWEREQIRWGTVVQAALSTPRQAVAR